MGRLRRGNYIFVWYLSDHPPPHVHIYEKGREIAKYNLRDLCLIKGTVSKKLERILEELLKEGVFDEIL